MSIAGRDSMFSAVARPNIWTCAWVKEEWYGDPNYYFHHVFCLVEASPRNARGVLIRLMQSLNGTTWNLLATPHGPLNPLVPGGMDQFNSFHVQPWLAMFISSAATAEIAYRITTPIDEVLPAYVRNEHLDSACIAYCEDASEAHCGTSAE